MSKTYVIKWKSKVNGRAGRGTKLFDHDEGEELVTELNRDYPDIQHELSDSGSTVSGPSTVDTAPEEVEETASNRPQVISFNT